ncbi:MAG TPA: zinc ABC transporter substrate-binding protein, partial [Candidatus Thalassarchaeaceae archaeon]
EESYDYDPHSWLDPVSFNEQLKLVQEKLTMAFPDGAVAFAENADAYSIELTELHDRFEQVLGNQGTCVTAGLQRVIVANHNAYSYISVRYNLDILTIHGLDPEGEPSPAEVAEVIEHIKEEGITTLFVEEYTDQTAVQSIVEETGVEVQVLYTMEMRPSDSSDDYLSMMNKNIENISSGIGC